MATTTAAANSHFRKIRGCSAQSDHRQPPPPSDMVVTYMECLKNHAAVLGGHALDGCGEFMPAPGFTPTDPVSLKCAACGCHRNFHRRDSTDVDPTLTPRPRSPNLSPGPISSPAQAPSSPNPYSFYSSAPEMLLALSTGGFSGGSDEIRQEENHSGGRGGGGKRKPRTRFSQEQKQRMRQFAEKFGWKMPRNEEKLVEELCGEIGIRRGVLRVWIHNHKQNRGKRAQNGGIRVRASSKNGSSSSSQ